MICLPNLHTNCSRGDKLSIRLVNNDFKEDGKSKETSVDSEEELSMMEEVVEGGKDNVGIDVDCNVEVDGVDVEGADGAVVAINDA